MTQYVGRCLVFAGACLLAAAGLSTAGWAICVWHDRKPNCESPLAAAVTAFTAASSAALGVALQERKP
jgi:drug/metabolite transporter (DMT)-like permease